MRQIRKYLIDFKSNKKVRKYLSMPGIKGIVFKAGIYFFLLEFAFVFLLPFITIITKAPKSMQDILNPVVYWLPTRIEFSNFTTAFETLNYKTTILNSMFLSIVPVLFQSISCAIAGYSIGRYKFWGRNLMFLLVILTIIVPPQTIVISRYLLYNQMDWINTFYPLIVPELVGHGLRGGLFVLIYSQFFKNIPLALEESARIDGCGPIRIFLQIVMPLAKSAIALVVIFSFVWHWNDTYSSSMFLSKSELMPAIVRFETLFDPRYASIYGTDSAIFNNDAVKMACALLIVLPLLIIYVVIQRQFTESIERTGLVE